MKKKALSLVLALMMCLGLTITPVWASPLQDPYIEIQTTEGEVIKFDPATEMSGNGWSYAPSSKTLTLDGFNGKSISFSRVRDDFIVELNGNNICSNSLSLIHYNVDANGSATITGNGTLTAESMSIGADTAIINGTVNCQQLSVRNNSAMTMAGGTINAVTKGLSNAVSIENNCSLRMTGGILNASNTRSGGSGKGIDCWGDLLLEDGMLSADGRDFGIYRGPFGTGDLLLKGGTTSAHGGKAAIWSAAKTESFSVDSFSVSGKITGGKTEEDSQVLSIYRAENSEDTYTTLAASELTVREGLDSNWAASSGAAKYVHIVGTAQPQQPTQPVGTQAQPTNDALTCDGKGQTPTVYKIDGSNYFKIRDLAAILNGTEKQFTVGYDSEKQSVTATTGQGYDKLDTDLVGAPAGAETAQISNDAIYVNGQKVEAQVYKIAGSNYFKLRDLGKALDFYVGWTQEKGMFIETDKPYSE